MNPRKRLVLQTISFAGLALSILPACLVFMGTLSKETFRDLKYDIDEVSSIPYKVDLVVYESLDNLALRDHIDGFGKSFLS